MPLDMSAVVGVIGGTGPQGRALASRWTAAGLAVGIGSRDPEKAKRVADEVTTSRSGMVDSGSNKQIVDRSDILLVAVPWRAHEDTLRELQPVLVGKIVVDCVNPLAFDEHGPYCIDVLEGSAAQQAQALLPGSRVVAAFHHVSAPLLADPVVVSFDLDVLVVSDDDDAADQVVGLAETIPGVRGIRAGTLRNARQVEALTANLVAINRRYRSHAGIRITDV